MTINQPTRDLTKDKQGQPVTEKVSFHYVTFLLVHSFKGQKPINDECKNAAMSSGSRSQFILNLSFYTYTTNLFLIYAKKKNDDDYYAK
jgi:hypothetical protein